MWEDLEALALSPLAAGQFRVWRRGATPVACAAWALVDAEGEARLLASETGLAPEEWCRGDRLWLVYLLAPYGGHQRFARELRDGVLADAKCGGSLPCREAGGGRKCGRRVRACADLAHQPVRPPGRFVDSSGHP